jgi:hypothetical protein
MMAITGMAVMMIVMAVAGTVGVAGIGLQPIEVIRK